MLFIFQWFTIEFGYPRKGIMRNIIAIWGYYSKYCIFNNYKLVVAFINKKSYSSYKCFSLINTLRNDTICFGLIMSTLCKIKMLKATFQISFGSFFVEKYMKRVTWKLNSTVNNIKNKVATIPISDNLSFSRKNAKLFFPF